MLGLFVLVSLPGSVRARTQSVKVSRLPNVVQNQNSQTMSLLEGHLNSNPTISAGKQLAVVDDSALLPDNPSTETFVDAGLSGNGQISTYIVRQNDTLSTIAKMFDVSANTIVWANDLKGSTVSPGQMLVILPVSGVKHTVVKGDTLQSIAKKYGADVDDILAYNNLTINDVLVSGQVVIVPDGELGSAEDPSTSGIAASKSPTKIVIKQTSNSPYGSAGSVERLLVNPSNYPSYPGYFSRPLASGVKTQGLHGYNAVDIGASKGTPIYAAAEGTVLVAKNNGAYNGGYGNYVVISHPNGTQTLYAHMSQDMATVGAHVNQGQEIGLVGSTGKSTGAHLHFEVRGAQNPF